MASAGRIKAGEAFVYIEAVDKTGRVFDRIGRRMKVFSNTLSDMGTKMIALGTTIGVAATGITAAFTKIGSDFQETINKFEIVFGDSAQEMRKWGEEYGRVIGRSKQQTLDFLADFRSIFFSKGIASQISNEMSQVAMQMAIDAASLLNVSDERAVSAIRNTILGRPQQLTTMSGVSVQVADVAERARALGLDPNNLSQQQLIMIRLTLAVEGLKAAYYDAYYTGTFFANTLKRLQAAFSDAALELRNQLVPAMTGLLNIALDLVHSGLPYLEKYFVRIILIAAGFTAGLITLGITLKLAGIFFLGVSAAATTLAVTINILTLAYGALNAMMAITITEMGLFLAADIAMGVVLAGLVGLIFLAVQAITGLRGPLVMAINLLLDFKEVFADTFKAIEESFMKGSMDNVITSFKLGFMSIKAEFAKFLLELAAMTPAGGIMEAMGITDFRTNWIIYDLISKNALRQLRKMQHQIPKTLIDSVAGSMLGAGIGGAFGTSIAGALSGRLPVEQQIAYKKFVEDMNERLRVSTSPMKDGVAAWAAREDGRREIDDFRQQIRRGLGQMFPHEGYRPAEAVIGAQRGSQEAFQRMVQYLDQNKEDEQLKELEQANRTLDEISNSLTQWLLGQTVFGILGQ